MRAVGGEGVGRRSHGAGVKPSLDLGREARLRAMCLAAAGARDEEEGDRDAHFTKKSVLGLSIYNF